MSIGRDAIEAMRPFRARFLVVVAVSAANLDRIDRRPDGSEILANLNQERRHASECALTIRKEDQARGKVGGRERLVCV